MHLLLFQLCFTEGVDMSPAASPHKDKNLATRALAPGVHRKSSNNSRTNSDRERSRPPTGGGHRPHPPAPPRRIPSHQSDSSHMSDNPNHLVLQPDSGYHGNNNMSRTGGQWNLANPGGNNGPHRDGYYYASHV